MKIKKINQSTVTADELDLYKERISKLKGFTFNALDVDMDKRIITIRFGGEYDELTLVNPVVIDKSNDVIVYFEKDSNKNKTRKTIRHTSVKVDSDNLGVVEFASDKKMWKTQDDLFNDMGLFECVTLQRLIDSIDGIDVNSPQRRYNQQVTAKKQPSRNDRVMIQSPNGETDFVKYKNAKPLLDNGYKLV